MRVRPVLALAACLAMAGVPVRAHAAPAPHAEARRLFEAGGQAYDKGRYGDACRAFRESYRLLPDSAIGFSLAQALRRQYFVDGDAAGLHEAARLYRAYLDEVPEGRRRADAVEQLQTIALLLAAAGPPDESDSPDEPPVEAPTELIVYASVSQALASVDGGPFTEVPLVTAIDPGEHDVVVKAPGFAVAQTRATAVRGRIIPVEAVLEPLPATVTVATTPGARVVFDGSELGYAPLSEPVRTSAGEHRVRITAPGRIRYESTLALEAGGTAAIDAPLPHTPQRRAAWGLLGTGGGLALAGGTTLTLALVFQRQAKQIEASRDDANLEADQRDEYNADVERRDRLRGAAIGLLSASLVATATGVLLVLLDRPERRRRSSPGPLTPSRARARPGRIASPAAPSARTTP